MTWLECVTSIAAIPKFMVKDCDPATGEPDSDEGYVDEYQLEDLGITVAESHEGKFSCSLGGTVDA